MILDIYEILKECIKMNKYVSGNTSNGGGF